MPSSNILLFDANKANMMSDEQYNTNTQRLNGVQSGIASSQLQNKTLYQVSLVAYAIAQIMNQNGLDANDTAAVSAFVANLSGTMLQKVADLATTQEAQKGVATGKWMSPALVKAAMDTYTSGKWLPLTGGTMKGNLILNADPTTNLGAATKKYVDNNRTVLIYNGSVTNNQNIGDLSKYTLLFGIATMTVPNNSDWQQPNPEMRLGGLTLINDQGADETGYDVVGGFIITRSNFISTASSIFMKTYQEKPVSFSSNFSGLITFITSSSGSLILYGI